MILGAGRGEREYDTTYLLKISSGGLIRCLIGGGHHWHRLLIDTTLVTISGRSKMIEDTMWHWSFSTTQETSSTSTYAVASKILAPAIFQLYASSKGANWADWEACPIAVAPFGVVTWASMRSISGEPLPTLTFGPGWSSLAQVQADSFWPGRNDSTPVAPEPDVSAAAGPVPSTVVWFFSVPTSQAWYEL